MTKKKVLQVVWTWFKHHPLSTLFALATIGAGIIGLIMGMDPAVLVFFGLILVLDAVLCFIETMARMCNFLTKSLLESFKENLIAIEGQKKRKK